MNKRMTMAVAITLALAQGLSFASAEKTLEEKSDVDRIEGKDRVDTSIKVSKKSYKKSEYVVLANGKLFQDALSGTVLSSYLKAPILLTSGENLEQNVIDEIQRLGAKKIFILGGKNTVSKNIEDKLLKNHTTFRLEGKNRYETSLRIYHYLKDVAGFNNVALVNGQNFADSLSASIPMAKNNIPIVLTDGIHKPNIDEKYVKYIIGGKKSINFDYKNATRISGKNRYETSYNIAKQFFPTAKDYIVTSGDAFADALSASTLGISKFSPILLVSKDGLNPYVSNIVKENKGSVTIVGGKSTIGSNIEGEIKKLYIKETPAQPVVDNTNPQVVNQQPPTNTQIPPSNTTNPPANAKKSLPKDKMDAINSKLNNLKSKLVDIAGKKKDYKTNQTPEKRTEINNLINAYNRDRLDFIEYTKSIGPEYIEKNSLDKVIASLRELSPIGDTTTPPSNGENPGTSNPVVPNPTDPGSSGDSSTGGSTPTPTVPTDNNYIGVADSIMYPNKTNEVTVNIVDDVIKNVKINMDKYGDDKDRQWFELASIIPSKVVELQDVDMMIKNIEDINSISNTLNVTDFSQRKNKLEELLREKFEDNSIALTQPEIDNINSRRDEIGLRNAISEVFVRLKSAKTGKNITYDTVSGATKSKLSLLNATKNAINKYKKQKSGSNVGQYKSIQENTRPKLNYLPGESLDLSELKVNLIDNNNSKVEVPFSKFGQYNITTNLENGSTLTNGTKRLVITHTPSNTSLQYDVVVNKPETMVYLKKIKFKLEGDQNYREFDVTNGETSFSTDINIPEAIAGKNITDFKLIDNNNKEINGFKFVKNSNDVGLDDVKNINSLKYILQVKLVDSAEMKAANETYKFKNLYINILSKANIDFSKLYWIQESSESTFNPVAYRGYPVLYTGLKIDLYDKSEQKMLTIPVEDFDQYGITIIPGQGFPLSDAEASKNSFVIKFNIKGADEFNNGAYSKLFDKDGSNPLEVRIEDKPIVEDTYPDPVVYEVKSIREFKPMTKKSYNEGDHLDLSGLVIELLDENGQHPDNHPEDYADTNVSEAKKNHTNRFYLQPDDGSDDLTNAFSKNNITTNLQNGQVLTANDNNLVITYRSVEHPNNVVTLNIPLTVTPKASEPVHEGGSDAAPSDKKENPAKLIKTIMDLKKTTYAPNENLDLSGLAVKLYSDEEGNNEIQLGSDYQSIFADFNNTFVEYGFTFKIGPDEAHLRSITKGQPVKAGDKILRVLFEGYGNSGEDKGKCKEIHLDIPITVTGSSVEEASPSIEPSPTTPPSSETSPSAGANEDSESPRPDVLAPSTDSGERPPASTPIETANSEVMRDGDWYGHGEGFHPDTGLNEVKVTVRNNRIVSAILTKFNDDKGFDKAKYLLPKLSNGGNIDEIYDNVDKRRRGTEWDTVTGATISARGILNAVKDAIHKSKNSTIVSGEKYIIRLEFVDRPNYKTIDYNSPLRLDDIRIRINYSDGTSKIIPFSEFEENGIHSNLQNGTIVTKENIHFKDDKNFDLILTDKKSLDKITYEFQATKILERKRLKTLNLVFADDTEKVIDILNDNSNFNRELTLPSGHSIEIKDIYAIDENDRRVNKKEMGQDSEYDYYVQLNNDVVETETTRTLYPFVNYNIKLKVAE